MTVESERATDSRNYTQGVLYIAFGDSFRSEAAASIRSLRSSSPGTACAVVTDQPWQGADAPDLVVIRPEIRSLYCKPKYMYEASPFDRTVFIDTDTLITRPIDPLFSLLIHYDVALRYVGPHLGGEGELSYHPWCSTGIVVFRRSSANDEMFSNWLTAYESALARENDLTNRGMNEEPSFARALAASNSRAVGLGHEMMFNIHECLVIYSPPVIVHGRDKRLAVIAREAFAEWTSPRDRHPRVWLPNIRGFLPKGIRRSDPVLALAIAGRRAWNELKRRLIR